MCRSPLKTPHLALGEPTPRCGMPSRPAHRQPRSRAPTSVVKGIFCVHACRARARSSTRRISKRAHLRRRQYSPELPLLALRNRPSYHLCCSPTGPLRHQTQRPFGRHTRDGILGRVPMDRFVPSSLALQFPRCVQMSTSTCSSRVGCCLKTLQQRRCLHEHVHSFVHFICKLFLTASSTVWVVFPRFRR